jgi:GNAT superfamily N-acetyltransferase
MRIRIAGPADAAAISRVVRSLSAQYIAPDCSGDGALTLLGSMEVKAIEEYLSSGYRYHVAEDQGAVVGVVGTRDGKHLYHLFVLDSHKGRGIGQALWRVAHDACLAAGNKGGFTVNSSRFALGFYRKLGFVEAGAEENRNGVVSIPMRLTEEPKHAERDARPSP